MKNFTKFIKLLFLPSFVYEHDTLLINSIDTISKKVRMLEGEIIKKNKNQILFKIKSSKLFGRLSFGKLLFHILYIQEEDKYKIKAQFVTYRLIFFSVAIMLSLLLIIKAITTIKLVKLLAIPLVLISGHILFWGILPSKIKRLKKVFYEDVEI